MSTNRNASAQLNDRMQNFRSLSEVEVSSLSPALALMILCACMALLGTAHAAPLLDPTQPYGAGNTSRTHAIGPAALQLEAILHGSQRRLAIVNGRMVHEGDRIADAVIESITATAVSYSSRGQRTTLRLARPVLPVSTLHIRPSTPASSQEAQP